MSDTKTVIKHNLTKANVSAAIALLVLAVVFFKAPASFHEAETVVGFALAAFLGFTPPWFKLVEQEIETLPAPPVAASKKLPPLPVLLLLALVVGIGAGASLRDTRVVQDVAAISPVAQLQGCNLSATQKQALDKTFSDGAAAGSCIISKVLAGIVDIPSLLLCAGATEQLVVDVIDDFKASHAADAGAPIPAAGAAIIPLQEQWLDTARANALVALAKKAPGK